MFEINTAPYTAQCQATSHRAISRRLDEGPLCIQIPLGAQPFKCDNRKKEMRYVLQTSGNFRP